MAGSGAAAGALGKYQLIAELGHGGMAEVYLAVAAGPANFNKLAVIKQIRPQFAEDPEFLTMFLDEARLAARLNHPNVVQTNEVGADDGRYFISMEYLEGQPLNRILSRVTREKDNELTLGMQLRVVVEALAGLHHAHELCDYDGTPLAVVHRDISPHNVFVTYAGQVKVVDFGIAKALSSSSETRTGVLKGKIAYMAPEQAMGERVDRRADIFSVGMVLWEVLAGRRMFKGVPDVAALQRIVSGDLPSPRSVQPLVPERLDALCMKALAPRREDRHESAAVLATDLEAAMDELGLKGSPREVGKLVEKYFESERARIKVLVEAHLSGVKPSDDPTFDPRRSGTGTQSAVGGTGAGSGSRARGRLPMIDAPATETTGQTGQTRSLPRIDDARSSTEPTTGTGRRSSPSSLTANTTTPDPDAPPPQASGRGRLIAAAVAVVLGAAGAAAFFASRAPVTASPPVAEGTHSIRIESSPAGATVSEGATALGKTPFTMSLDPAAGAHHLVVSLEGYMPYALEQGPAPADVRLVVPLVPVGWSTTAPTAAVVAATASATAEATTRAKAPPPRAPAPPPPVVAPPPPRPPSDINMAR
jgi:serine/threonine-protein kinase